MVRRKSGRPSVHYIRDDEIRALRKVQREQIVGSPYVFVSKRKGPLTVAAFRKLFTRIGQATEFPFPIHPHMLRHSCGFRLANDGHFLPSTSARPRPRTREGAGHFENLHRRCAEPSRFPKVRGPEWPFPARPGGPPES